MKVRQIMTKDVESCTGQTDLANAAMIMWRKDCGIVPVVDGTTRRVLGVITDRDICMAVATRHQRPEDISVDSVMSGKLHAVTPDQELPAVLGLMKTHRVRRLPVLDPEGCLAGIVSIMDLVQHAVPTPGHAKPTVSALDVVEVLRTIRGARPLSEKSAEPARS